MEGLKLDQFLGYKFLSNVRWAPDGKHAAFVVSAANEGENSYDACLWLYADGKVKQLTGMDHESVFYWEDEKNILFPAVRTAADKKRAEKGEIFTKYYRIAIDGGEAVPAFELPVKAGELHQIAGSLYWFTSVIDATHPDAYLDDAETRAAKVKEDKDNEDYIVLEDSPFYFNGDTFRFHRRVALFTADLTTMTVKRITEPLMSVDKAVTLGGKVYYLGDAYSDIVTDHNGLYCYDPATGATAELEASRDGSYPHDIEPYKDGLIYLHSEGKTYGSSEIPFIYFYDVNTREKTLLNENYLTLHNAANSDCRYGSGYGEKVLGDELYILATIRDHACLMLMGADGKLTAVNDAQGSVDCFDINADGELLAVCMLDGKLQELYISGENGWKQLTSFNEAILTGKYVAEYEKITVKSEGEEIDGWILKPADYDPLKKYPAILDIHGGPRTIYGEIFYHEMQYWAGHGYFVFYCNPIGSDGRGDAFSDIYGKYGEHDFANIMDFTDAVLARYPQIDPDRVGVTGGSYGGFMTNWIIGHTDRFRAAATQRSITNWTSFYGCSDIGPRFCEFQNQASILSDPALLWKQSPIAYAGNFKTPTLIIHSDQDYRCPIEQGYQLLTSLNIHHIDTRMVIFKGENHELSRGGRPKHRVRRLKEITEWMDKYCK